MNEFNVTEAMDLLHGYAIQLNDLHDEISELYSAYDFLPNSMRLKIDNDSRDLNDLLSPIAENLKSYFLSRRHGGVRKGAGRKKQEPTVQIRIPYSIADLLIDFKSNYVRLDDESKDFIQERLMDLVKDCSLAVPTQD